MARARRNASDRPDWPELSWALGGAEVLLSLLALRLAEPSGFLPPGTCAALAQLAPGELRLALGDRARALRRATGSTLPPWTLSLAPGEQATRAAAELLGMQAPGLDQLSLAAEALRIADLGARGRREAGLYYTPPAVAEQVVALALEHGSIAPDALPSVVDPCAGAGIFLAAAARALAPRAGRARAALACSGADLDAAALRTARAQVVLCAGPAPAAALAGASMKRRDSLRSAGPPADLLVSNPPYGRLADEGERAFLARALPGLRGGEIDRYAAFLLRSLALVRPGGTAALLIPDTWMTNARARALRAAVLDAAEIAAVADLGKPFPAAKDTRVQALVLVRRLRRARPPRPAFTARLEGDRLVPLEALPESALRASVAAGFRPYRSRAEGLLCAAMERGSLPLGEVCAVGYGLRTGDNAAHVARRRPEPGEVALCGGEDVVPFALRWRPKALARATPALAALAARQLGQERIAVQRIRTNSGLPWARWLEAAPAAPGQICLDSLSTLACASDDLRWALLAWIHSVAVNRYHRLRTTDVNVKPSALRELPVPRALLDPAEAAALAELSRARAEEARRALAAGGAAAAGRGLREVAAAPALERAIDRRVYALYGLPEEAVEESERGFWGPRFEAERARLPPGAAGSSAAMSDPARRVASSGRSP